MRRCYMCGKGTDEVEFNVRRKSRDGLDNACKECAKIRTKKNQRKTRKMVLEHYGGECACCGINDYEFLCIDHVNGGGHQHRKKVGHGYKFLRWLITNDFPEEYRILCHNCNMATGLYGYCPHGNLPEQRR